ncbi:MAG: DUF7007 domain-containing protein [Oscillospiraceae bacterium]
MQTCDLLCPGVFLVSTASHGGTMVSRRWRPSSPRRPSGAAFSVAAISALRKIRRRKLCCGSS